MNPLLHQKKSLLQKTNLINNLFILGGKQPKVPTKPSTSVLGQALGTTGLTASRGAGEIEDTSTGKKRKKVWNEETLRLKDALGV